MYNKVLLWACGGHIEKNYGVAVEQLKRLVKEGLAVTLNPSAKTAAIRRLALNLDKKQLLILRPPH